MVLVVDVLQKLCQSPNKNTSQIIWPLPQTETRVRFSFFQLEGNRNIIRKPSLSHGYIKNSASKFSYISFYCDWFAVIWDVTGIRMFLLAELESFPYSLKRKLVNLYAWIQKRKHLGREWEVSLQCVHALWQALRWMTKFKQNLGLGLDKEDL